MFGDNTYGQLGTGNTADLLSPTPRPPPSHTQPPATTGWMGGSIRLGHACRINNVRIERRDGRTGQPHCATSGDSTHIHLHNSGPRLGATPPPL